MRHEQVVLRARDPSTRGYTIKSSSITAIAVFVFLVAAAPAFTTTVYPVTIHCPVCGQVFLSLQTFSYFTCGEQARDLSDKRSGIFDSLTVCPFCLYGAFRSDFDALSEKEGENLRRLLPGLKLTLDGEERRLLVALGADELLLRDHLLGLLIVRECYRHRLPNPERDLCLLLELYYWTEFCDESLHSYYRRQAIALLAAQLGSNLYEGAEKARYTYLVGELSRLEGEKGKALEYFSTAYRLAKKLPDAGEQEREDRKWLEEWSQEQSCRIDFQDKSAAALRAFIKQGEDISSSDQLRMKVALQVLADRDDPEAWGVLGKYLMEDIRNLDLLNWIAPLSKEKLGINPKLLAWVERQYDQVVKRTEPEAGRRPDIIWVRLKNILERLLDKKKRPSLIVENEDDETTLAKELALSAEGDIFRYFEAEVGASLEDIAQAQKTTAARLLELNPDLRDINARKAPASIRLIDIPAGWEEERMLANLQSLIKKGDKRARQYFASWFPTLGRSSLSEFHYKLDDCLVSLARVPDGWKIDIPDEYPDFEELEFTRCCLEYLQGEPSARSKLHKFISSKKIEVATVAYMCLIARGDDYFKKTVIENPGDHERIRARYPDAEFISTSHLESIETEYLKRVGGPEDILQLKASSLKARSDEDLAGLRPSQFDLKRCERKAIEGIIYYIQLRELLRRSGLIPQGM